MSSDAATLAKLTGPLVKTASKTYKAEEWLVLEPSDKAKRWTDNYASVLPHLSIWENAD
jgi:hypothetical protein